MNKRIRELAEQAGASYYNTYTGPLLSPKDIEKFAELIVRECIAVHEDDYGIDIIGNVLKKHFGVEE
jgi:methylmalonyl-CoA mutase cobalamin-binding subunit